MENEYPIPSNEEKRLDLLYEAEIFDSSPDDSNYDRYAALAMRIFHATSANIAFAEYDKVFIKSRITFGNKLVYHLRRNSIDALYLFDESPDVYVIPDVHSDPKYICYAKLPTYENIKFMAGATIIVDGVKLGHLVITDSNARHDFNLQQQMNLLDLASTIGGLISGRRRTLMNINAMRKLNCILELLKESARKSNIYNTTTMDSLKQIQHKLLQHEKDEKNWNDVSNIDFDNLLNNKQEEEEEEENNDDDEEDAKNKEILLSMGNCVRCNIFEIIAQSQSLIQTMIPSASNRITWIIDRTYLDYGQHICYPDVILYVLTSSISYLSTIWENLYLRIGFKKSHTQRNHKRSLQRNKSKPGIMEGRLAIEVHFNNSRESNLNLIKLPEETVLDISEASSNYLSSESMIYASIDDTLNDVNESLNIRMESFAKSPLKPFVNILTSHTPTTPCTSSSDSLSTADKDEPILLNFVETDHNTKGITYSDRNHLSTNRKHRNLRRIISNQSHIKDSNEKHENRETRTLNNQIIGKNIIEVLNSSEGRVEFSMESIKSNFLCIDDKLRDISGSSRYTELCETIPSYSTCFNDNRMSDIIYDSTTIDKKAMDTASFCPSMSSLNDSYDFENKRLIKDRYYDYAIPCYIAIAHLENTQSSDTNRESVGCLTDNPVINHPGDKEDCIRNSSRKQSICDDGNNKNDDVSVHRSRFLAEFSKMIRLNRIESKK